MLGDLNPVFGDPEVIKVESVKFLINDIQFQQTSMGILKILYKIISEVKTIVWPKTH